MQNVLIILDWCLCDFLVLKHIKVIYWCWHIFVWKMFQNFNIVFDYLLMLTYFSCAKCSYHFQLMFMWFSCTETYQGHLLMLTYFCVENVPEFQYCFWLFSDVDIFFMCKMFLSFLMTDVETYQGHLLMLTYFCVENVPEFQYCFWLFSDVDIFHVQNVLINWCTETYQLIVWTSSSLVIYWCWHIFVWKMFQNFNIVFWLFSDVDIFFMCKMFLSFSTDVYVIFLYLNISRSFTDVDIFLCGKCSRISILFLII